MNIKQITDKKGTLGPQTLAATLFINFGCISKTMEFIKELEATFRIYPDGFARHFEPRNDQQNLFGNSWSEILNTSRYKFNKYFDEIGVRYNSPDELPSKEIKDCFQGKLYCRVFIKNDNGRTHYYRNHDLANRLLAIGDCANNSGEIAIAG